MANEKYIGDALLQKSFTVDFIAKKKKKNECELSKYYVEGSHEAIIPKSVYEYIKNMPEKKNWGKVSGLSEKIICRHCGTDFRHFVMYSERDGGNFAWRCKNNYNKDNKCSYRHLYDKKGHNAIVKAALEQLTKRKKLMVNIT